MAANSQHPDFGVIKVVMTDGTEFETRSTISRGTPVLQLDIDSKSHNAWTGDNSSKSRDRHSEVQKFKSKYDLDDLS